MEIKDFKFKIRYFSTMPDSMLNRLMKKEGLLQIDRDAIAAVLVRRAKQRKQERHERERAAQQATTESESRKRKRPVRWGLRGAEYVLDRGVRFFRGGAVRPK